AQQTYQVVKGRMKPQQLARYWLQHRRLSQLFFVKAVGLFLQYRNALAIFNHQSDGLGKVVSCTPAPVKPSDRPALKEFWREMFERVLHQLHEDCRVSY